MRNWLDSEEAWVHSELRRKVLSRPVRSSEVVARLIGRQGIVAFFNFWGPGNTGDHIDVWNGSRIALARRPVPHDAAA
jgi:hypothetical protein